MRPIYQVSADSADSTLKFKKFVSTPFNILHGLGRGADNPVPEDAHPRGDEAGGGGQARG